MSGLGRIPSSPFLPAIPLSAKINAFVGQAITEARRPDGASFLFVAPTGTGSTFLRVGPQAQRTFADGDVDVGADAITIANHGYQDGDGPVRLSNAGGALPGGLSAGVDFWIHVVDANTIQLAVSQSNAMRRSAENEDGDSTPLPIVVDITSAAGGGTHSIGVTDLAQSSASSEDGQEALELDPTVDDRIHVFQAPEVVTFDGETGAVANYWWL